MRSSVARASALAPRSSRNTPRPTSPLMSSTGERVGAALSAPCIDASMPTSDATCAGWANTARCCSVHASPVMPPNKACEPDTDAALSTAASSRRRAVAAWAESGEVLPRYAKNNARPGQPSVSAASSRAAPSGASLASATAICATMSAARSASTPSSTGRHPSTFTAGPLRATAIARAPPAPAARASRA